ncbi:unnamed protein product [Moneuplotes crassus]|uniref:Uncharacterized protein n=1 Tax=Euplotes crassus TaxID=5936 RepID=A0AAD1Y6H4_EUPCR|nr:unnamed protein product [Moneuplotes crassus]
MLFEFSNKGSFEEIAVSYPNYKGKYNFKDFKDPSNDTNKFYQSECFSVVLVYKIRRGRLFFTEHKVALLS